ncbi:MAG: ABC transporter substrate-binding protein [Sedimentitalea sp.]
MQELAPAWEKATGNTINWVVLEENVQRQRTPTDIATGGGSFDIMFIGAYETPIWGAKDWFTPLNDFADDADYELEDVFPLVRNGLSANSNLYALPLHSETSFTFYRKDLFEAAGVAVPPSQPSCTTRKTASMAHVSAARPAGVRTWRLLAPLPTHSAQTGSTWTGTHSWTAQSGTSPSHTTSI